MHARPSGTWILPPPAQPNAGYDCHQPSKADEYGLLIESYSGRRVDARKSVKRGCKLRIVVNPVKQRSENAVEGFVVMCALRDIERDMKIGHRREHNLRKI